MFVAGARVTRRRAVVVEVPILGRRPAVINDDEQRIAGKAGRIARHEQRMGHGENQKGGESQPQQQHKRLVWLVG